MDFLFDIGRVLLDFDFDASMRKLMRNSPPGSRARLMESLEQRNDFESGQVSAQSFVDRVIAESGATIDPADFILAWRHVFTRNEPMWEVVRRLQSASGHRLILFSNTNEIHCPWFLEEFPEFRLFDAAVFSFEVGAMKPAAAIYQHAIDHHSLDPTATRYIDDLPENISAGIGFGFRSHLYDLKNHAAFETWLEGELRVG